MTNLKIEMLSTGDEVLYGQIVDTNSAWLSDFLFQEGLSIRTRFTVGDDLNQLIDALQTRSKENDILIVNGGLGPTSDDLTAEAAAIANNESLVLHAEWIVEMEQYFAGRGKKMPISNRKQAMLPKSATIVDNPVGTACGFRMQMNDCVIFFTPGVPFEFKEMTKHTILPYIKKHYPSEKKPLCYRLTTMGRSESDLAADIETKLTIPADIKVGYRSAMPIIELKLTGPEDKKEQMDQLWIALKALVKGSILYEGVLAAEGKLGLAEVVSQLLHDKNLQLTVVEQYTAGLIGYQLYAARAPLSESEVKLQQIIDESYLINLFKENKSDIILGLVDFSEKNSQFKLIIVTADRTYQYQLKYTSRRYDTATEQTIYAAIALDGLRRYLMGLPIVGANIWLEEL